MKIKFLGTAAYEGVPSIFCECEVCQKSLRLGGRNLRTRSQALINDDLLLDFPPDTVAHYLTHKFEWSKIGDCLITHSHSDHIYPEDVAIAAPGYATVSRKIRFYAAEDGYRKLLPFVESTKGNASVQKIAVGERFTVADGKYTVLALPADHAAATSPVFYSITCENKRMLYAHDTGEFSEEAWKGLKSEGRYDLVSLDCTGCLAKGGAWRRGHMSFQTNLEIIDRMKREGLADEKTVFVVNHFSHNGGQCYDDMAAEAEPLGVTVSYDGLEIEV